MIDRPRLIPAVILGAMGLLALKLLAWTSAPYPGTVPASKPVFAQADIGADRIKTTGTHVPDLPFDPLTTGSVDKPAPKKDEAAGKDDAAQAANPNNKAGLINGTAKPVSAGERALLERLGQRREEIEQRMRDIEMRERLLDSAEKKLEGRFGAEQSAAAAPDPAKARAEEETKAVKNLVIMYEAMKPKDAARVFDRLTLDILVPVVQQMNPRKMSEVLASMAPEKAEKLTVALATGRASPVERQADLRPAGGNELQAIAPGTR